MSTVASRIAARLPSSAANNTGQAISRSAILPLQACSIIISVSTISRLRTPSPETIASVSDPTPHPNSIASPKPTPHRLPAALLIRVSRSEPDVPCLRHATVTLSARASAARQRNRLSHRPRQPSGRNRSIASHARRSLRDGLGTQGNASGLTGSWWCGGPILSCKEPCLTLFPMGNHTFLLPARIIWPSARLPLASAANNDNSSSHQTP